MEITLYQNISEKNKINKTLVSVATLSGTLKEITSVMNPVITIEYNTPTGFNYCYIPTFERYYFVSDVTIIRNNLIQLKLSVDVLESFKTQILAQNVIINKSQSNKQLYLPDENWKTLVKTKTDIVNFPNGFLDDGEFILITAGGGVTP